MGIALDPLQHGRLVSIRQWLGFTGITDPVDLYFALGANCHESLVAWILKSKSNRFRSVSAATASLRRGWAPSSPRARDKGRTSRDNETPCSDPSCSPKARAGRSPFGPKARHEGRRCRRPCRALCDIQGGRRLRAGPVDHGPPRCPQLEPSQCCSLAPAGFSRGRS
jgi:hypothetical protein